MNPEELFDECCTEIDSAYVRLGHTLGWRFLTCPRSSFVEYPKVALVTLNPAGSRDYPELPRRSQEDGSAYIIESWDGVCAGTAPLQRQIRKFFELIASRTGVSSGDALLAASLTANFVPFRSARLKTFRISPRR